MKSSYYALSFYWQENESITICFKSVLLKIKFSLLKTLCQFYFRYYLIFTIYQAGKVTYNARETSCKDI